MLRKLLPLEGARSHVDVLVLANTRLQTWDWIWAIFSSLPLPLPFTTEGIRQNKIYLVFIVPSFKPVSLLSYFTINWHQHSYTTIQLYAR
jgi:hypothetical protein